LKTLETQFGKYSFLRKLASGGMGEVFLARQSGEGGFEKILAIKTILPHLAQDEKFIAMFLDEARTSALLNHGNIIQIFELGKIDQTYYIAMEYVSGANLKSLLEAEQRRLQLPPLPAVVYIMMSTCLGLDYAHRCTDHNGNPLNIVHRDISPQNILVSDEGQVKIGDFGIARASDRLSSTSIGMLKGKVAYMSPEQAAGNPFDCRSDIFSTGVVLYELLTAQRPFDQTSGLKTLKAIQENDYIAVSKLNPQVGPGLEKIVDTCLQKEPSARFQSARELYLALKEFAAESFSGPVFYSSHELSQYLRGLLANYVDAPGSTTASNEIPKSTDTLIAATPQKSEASGRIKQGSAEISSGDTAVVEPNEKLREVTTPAPRHSIEHTEIEIPGEFGPIKQSETQTAGMDYPPLHPELRTQQKSDRTNTRRRRWQSIQIIMLLLLFLGLGYISLRQPFAPGQTPLIPKITSQPVAPKPTPDHEPGQRNSQHPQNPSPPDNRPPTPPTQGSEANGSPTRNTPRSVIDLEISSIPPKAMIVVDGEVSGQETPTIIRGLKLHKTYKLSLRKEGFHQWTQDFSPQKNGPNTLNVDLIRKKGDIQFVQLPSGATITLNGHKFDLNENSVLANVPIGLKQLVVIHKEGYLPQNETITLTEEKPRAEIQVNLKPFDSDLLVISNPPEASCFLEGQLLGTTPISIRIPLAKQVALMLRKNGYYDTPWTGQFSAQPPPLRISLRPLPTGTLTIYSRPANMSVFIDGKLIEATPFYAKLDEFPNFLGSHVLTLGYNDFVSQEFPLQIENGKANKFKFEFLGGITVKLRGNEENIEAYLDGEKERIQKIPCKFDNIPIGNHTLHIRSTINNFPQEQIVNIHVHYHQYTLYEVQPF
jgi:serine/threonine protein kinase